MSAEHEWESSSAGSGDREAAYAHHEWENSDAEAEAEDLRDEDSDEIGSQASSDESTAVQEFLKLLFAKYYENAESAQFVCLACHWAGKLAKGIPEEVVRFGKAPGFDSGAYQKHLDRRLGWSRKSGNEYKLPLMTYQEQEMGRAEYLLPMEPLHEVVQDELEDDPSVLVRLDEALESDRLPRCYYENPVVAEARRNGEDPPNPIGLYMDGLPYSLTDSVLGVWAVVLMTGARRLVAVVRKKLVCQCGCRGWCTYWGLLWCLRWSCDALAAGFFQTTATIGWGGARATLFAVRGRARQ